MWRETRVRFGAGGPFLFGADFTNADVTYAPVVCRFLTYKPELSAEAEAYCAAVRAHPLMNAWYEAAVAEPEAWLIPQYEMPA
jgi:glutathione S-transferase